MQLSACIQKENREFTRTYRLLGALISFVFFAASSPILAKITPKILEMMGMNTGSSTIPGMSMIAANMEYSMITFISNAVQLSLLVVLLCFMSAAGGEIKKQTCIIPISSGLKRSNYIAGKFLYCVPVAFILALFGYIMNMVVSLFFFPQDIAWKYVFITALSFSLLFAFTIALQLALGLMTGKAGISVLISMITVFFGSTILSAFRLNKYSPLALMDMSIAFSGNLDYQNIFVTLSITIASIIALAFITIFVFNRKCLK